MPDLGTIVRQRPLAYAAERGDCYSLGYSARGPVQHLAGWCLVIDEFAKDYLHGDLRWKRQALLWKLDGLSDYDIRRPLTPTGTNLLRLVKHLTTLHATHFAAPFD